MFFHRNQVLSLKTKALLVMFGFDSTASAVFFYQNVVCYQPKSFFCLYAVLLRCVLVASVFACVFNLQRLKLMLFFVDLRIFRQSFTNEAS